MRMSEELQVLNLSLDSTGHISTDQLSPAYRLHCDLLLGDLMPSQLDLPEGAFPNILNELVLVQSVVGLLRSWRLGEWGLQWLSCRR